MHAMRGLRAYLDDALEQIRTTALFSSSVDWDEVGREVGVAAFCAGAACANFAG
jgi:hypothetical protein